MQRVLKSLIVALAAFGLAAGAGTALAQKTEPTKPAAAPAAPKAAAPAAAPAPKADAKAAAPAAAPKGEPMDINSASEAELATLKGIGEARSKAIVKGRPYKGKDDLVKKKIIPQSVYDDIKDQIIAKQDTAKAAAPAKAAEPAKAPAKPEEKKK